MGYKVFMTVVHTDPHQFASHEGSLAGAWMGWVGAENW